MGHKVQFQEKKKKRRGGVIQSKCSSSLRTTSEAPKNPFDPQRQVVGPQCWAHCQRTQQVHLLPLIKGDKKAHQYLMDSLVFQ